jgi:hypothetical protein
MRVKSRHAGPPDLAEKQKKGPATAGLLLRGRALRAVVRIASGNVGVFG